MLVRCVIFLALASGIQAVDMSADAQLRMKSGATYLAIKTNMPELIPSDFVTSLTSPDLISKLLYAVSVIVLGCIVTAIYFDRGMAKIAQILTYIYALSSMSVLISNVYKNHEFIFPQWVTASHFLATGLTGLAVLLHRKVIEGREITIPSNETLYKGIAPVGLAFALSLGFANRGLMYTNTHFYEMMASTSMLVTAGVGVLMGKGFNLKLLPPLVTLTLGLCIVSFGEVSFSLLGFACIGLGTIMRATKVQLQSVLLSADSGMTVLDPIELTVWTAAVCFTIMMVWSLAVEGLQPFVQIVDLSTFLAVLITAMAATVLNIAALFVLKEVGPVAQQIVGNLKGVLACMAAVAAFGEQISMKQAIGYSIVVACTFWFNRTDATIKEAAKKVLENEPLWSSVKKV